MDILGTKTQALVKKIQEKQALSDEIQKDISQLQSVISERVEALEHQQENTDQRLKMLEDNSRLMAQEIIQLQDSVDEMRNSAIRGEIASGQKTKDVAEKYKISSARVSQIAPRRGVH